MDFRIQSVGAMTGTSCFGYSSVADSCEHSNESSVSMKAQKYFDQESNYYLLKEDCLEQLS
jgi:hypothetical protein